MDRTPMMKSSSMVAATDTFAFEQGGMPTVTLQHRIRSI